MDKRKSVDNLQKLNIKDLLKSIPVKNKLTTEVFDSELGLLIKVPIRKKWYIKLIEIIAFNSKSHRALQLDSLGVVVYKECNGNNTLENIIDKISEMFCLTFHESRLIIMQFLESLIQNGVIAVLVGGEISDEKN